jgi:agmatine deiminase
MPRSKQSTNSSNAVPAAAGYRMPAEWERHAATWLAWPHYQADWPGKFEPIPWIYAEIIRNLSRHERVELLVNDAAAERNVRKILERAATPLTNIRFHRHPTNRIWLRDSGSIFVTPSGGTTIAHVGAAALGCPLGPSAPDAFLAINFRFNAWAKYTNYSHDQKIGSLMATVARTEEIRPIRRTTRIVLEGGSIDVNGQGAILTTEECLLSKIQQRNAGMSRKDYETVFSNYFGAPHTIWLNKGIVGDDTHGHVDDLARFVSPNTVVTVVEPNRKDANHKTLAENLRRLKSATDQDGKPLTIVELPMPRPVIFEKRRLPASYANFYIANGIVLAPVFNDPNDRIALKTLAELFPTREIVPIYSGDLVWGLGTMHCMTQQQPAN